MIHLFNINFNKLITELLPTIWKTTNKDDNDNYQWLKSLIKPIQTLQDDEVYIYRDNTYYDINHNYQVYSLEHYLNEYFGTPFPINYSESIWISDGEKLDEQFLMQNEEFFINFNDEPIYLYQNNELENSSFDIKVSFSYGNDGLYDKVVDNETNEITYVNQSDNTKIIRYENGYWVIDDSEWGVGTAPQFVRQWYLYDGTLPPSTSITRPTQCYENTYLYEQNEYLQGVSFIIHCPTALQSVQDFENKLLSIVEKYRIAGFTAIINYY